MPRKKISPEPEIEYPLAKNQKKEKIYTLLFFVLIVVAMVNTVFVGLIFQKLQNIEKNGVLGAQNPQQALGAVPSGPPPKVDVAKGKLAVLGNKDAKITIVEFSDFQCPYCQKFFTEAYAQIKKDYIDTGKVALHFRHLPLSFHQAARPSALASECANEQGKFWEFHDKVFSSQDKISAGTVEENKQALKVFAQELGLDIDKFNQCFDSEKYKDNVTTDETDAQKAGANGTPTFYINGTQLIGAQPYEAFKALIDQELKK